MTTPPVLVQLSLPINYGIPPRDLLRLATLADEAGLDGVVCGEVAATDAVALLAAAAPVTRRVRLETNVLSVLSRSPSLLAMTASTIADLSGGRFVLGLGAGSPAIAGFHGTTFEDPVGRVERWLLAVRRALAGEKLRELGSFRLSGVAPAAVPLVLAAVNPRMLDLAGRLADGVTLNLCGPDQVREYGARARAAAAGAGREQSFEVHTMLWLDTTGDPEQGRRRFALEMAPYLAVPTYRSAVVAMAGEEAVDRVASVWKAEGREAAAAVFPDAIIDQLVATDTADAGAKIAGFAQAGCTGVRVSPLVHEPTARPGELAIEMLAAVSRDLRNLRAVAP